MNSSTTLPIWNPFKKGYLENPHEQLRLLREQNPAHKGISGRWMFFRYADVKAILANPTFKTFKLGEHLRSKNKFLAAPDNLSDLATVVSKWLFFLDPPEHTELRPLVTKVWNQYKVQHYIEQLVAEGIENIKYGGQVEVVKEFACFVPIRIICKILGFPVEDYIQLLEWAPSFANTLELFENAHNLLLYNETAKAFFKYTEAVMEAKTRKPDDSFISNFLIANKTLENPLTHEELVSVFIIFFYAGIETSIYLFGQSVLHLIRNPEQLQLLRNDLSLTYQAVEELLRYSSPLQYTSRLVAEAVEIGGQPLNVGDTVLCCVASANRDPQVFENPEKLDFTRKYNPHLSFGHGFHHCIGAKLARDEMNAALPAFVKQFSKIELDPEKSYEWEKIITNRGLKSLPVILHC